MSAVELRIRGMELVRTRALICGTCRHAVGGECGLDGRSLASHLGAAGGPLECRAGKQADWDGHVRWMGVRWVGVPWIVRVWRWSKDRDEGWLRVPGCGCIVALKRSWTKAREALGRFFAK